jgi:hypothetical protein
MRSWDIVLGMVTGNDGIAADWIVKLVIDGSTATVVTTNYLMNDGALANGEAHDALRTDLLRALILGQETDAAAEASVSSGSLTLAQPFPSAAPSPFLLSFAIVTSLDEATSRDRLIRLVGYRMLDDSVASIRWGLGLSKNNATDHVTVQIRSGRLEATASIGSTAAVDRRIAAKSLHGFIGRAVLVQKVGDAVATFEGPMEWKP